MITLIKMGDSQPHFFIFVFSKLLWKENSLLSLVVEFEPLSVGGDPSTTTAPSCPYCLLHSVPDNLKGNVRQGVNLPVNK